MGELFWFHDDQLNRTYVKGLYWFKFSKKTNKQSAREGEFHIEAYQAARNQAERKIKFGTVGKKILLTVGMRPSLQTTAFI